MVLTTANDPLLVPLGAGEHVRWADFGFATVLNTEVALGDYVWYDKDADGQQDSYPGNPAMDESSTNAGLQCVTVKLYMNDVNDPQATPVWIGQANTDSFGLYQFVRLPEGGYSVRVDQNDVDIAQIADWSNPTKPCHKVAEWVNLAGGPPAAMRPLGATTPAVVGPYFIPGGTANWTYDFGFTTSPTAVSLQTLSATSLAGLPAGTVLMSLAWWPSPQQCAGDCGSSPTLPIAGVVANQRASAIPALALRFPIRAAVAPPASRCQTGFTRRDPARRRSARCAAAFLEHLVGVGVR